MIYVSELGVLYIYVLFESTIEHLVKSYGRIYIYIYDKKL